MKTDSLTLYIECCRNYDKYTRRLMRLSNKKLIEEAKREFQSIAQDYIDRLKSDPAASYYIKRISEDISTVNDNF